jgi:hypothetical protein
MADPRTTAHSAEPDTGTDTELLQELRRRVDALEHRLELAAGEAWEWRRRTIGLEDELAALSRNVKSRGKRLEAAESDLLELMEKGVR